MEANIKIHSAKIDEIDLIMEWRMRVLSVVFEGDEYDADALYTANREYYETHIPAGEHITCFAYNGDEIVGCGGICFQDELPSPDNPNGKVGYLMNALTLPKCRNHGICESILSWLMERAFEKGIYKICLEATDIGKHMYTEKLGFSDYKDYMIYDSRKKER